MPSCIEEGRGSVAGRLPRCAEASRYLSSGDEQPLLWALAAAASGILLDRWVVFALGVWCALLASLLLGAWYTFRCQRDRAAALLVLGSLAALSGVWHHHHWYLYRSDELSRFATDRAVALRVRVQTLDAPRHCPAAREGPLSTMTRDETTRLVVRATAVRQGSRWRRVSGRLVLIVEGRLTEVPEILRGDQLEVAALLVPVRAPRNPGEPDFAGMCRGRRQRAVLLCEHPDCVRRLRTGTPWSLLRQIGRVRLKSEEVLDRHVGQHAPLAAALLLGSRERLDQESVQNFFASGSLHLLAVSGLHVGILATAFWLLLRLQWLPRHRLLWATCLLAVGYALLTGARPPVVRAATLVVIYCLARGLGRAPQPWNSWSAAGLVTLTLRPSGLLDAGTQLSFLAVGTLIAVWPWLARSRTVDPLDRLTAARRPIGWRACCAAGSRVRQLLLVSAAVWLVSLPLVAFRFHMVAPVGLVLNVLLWLPLVVALFTALLTLLTAPVPVLPDLFGAICGMVLSWVDLLTSQAAVLSGGHYWVVGPPGWWVVGFYVGLMVRQFARLPLPHRWWWALLCGWLTLGVANGSCAERLWRARVDAPLRLSFIAVGHGNAVLVEMPGGEVLLYDAGRMGSPRAAALPISSVLWSRRIRHIDAIVLSHADADHFNAVPELLERFSVGAVYVSPVMFNTPAPALQELQAALDRSGVPVAQLFEGMRWRSQSGVVLEALHPPSDEQLFGPRDSGDNSNSIVLELSHGQHRVQLTGDVERGGLDELLAEMPMHCDLLLAPHHGSRHSRPADLIRWTRASQVVISAGRSLPIESAQAAYGARGAAVYWTHRDGMVEAVSDGRQLRVSCWSCDE